MPPCQLRDQVRGECRTISKWLIKVEEDVLQGLGVTFRVGAADQPTSAQRRLRDVSAVEAMLRWLAARP